MASRIHFTSKTFVVFSNSELCWNFQRNGQKEKPCTLITLNRQTGQLEHMTSLSLLLTILRTLYITKQHNSKVDVHRFLKTKFVISLTNVCFLEKVKFTSLSSKILLKISKNLVILAISKNLKINS